MALISSIIDQKIKPCLFEFLSIYSNRELCHIYGGQAYNYYLIDFMQDTSWDIDVLVRNQYNSYAVAQQIVEYFQQKITYEIDYNIVPSTSQYNNKNTVKILINNKPFIDISEENEKDNYYEMMYPANINSDGYSIKSLEWLILNLIDILKQRSPDNTHIWDKVFRRAKRLLFIINHKGSNQIFNYCFRKDFYEKIAYLSNLVNYNNSFYFYDNYLYTLEVNKNKILDDSCNKLSFKLKQCDNRKQQYDSDIKKSNSKIKDLELKIKRLEKKLKDQLDINNKNKEQNIIQNDSNDNRIKDILLQKEKDKTKYTLLNEKYIKLEEDNRALYNKYNELTLTNKEITEKYSKLNNDYKNKLKKNQQLLQKFKDDDFDKTSLLDQISNYKLTISKNNKQTHNSIKYCDQLVNKLMKPHIEYYTNEISKLNKIISKYEKILNNSEGLFKQFKLKVGNVKQKNIKKKKEISNDELHQLKSKNEKITMLYKKSINDYSLLNNKLTTLQKSITQYTSIFIHECVNIEHYNKFTHSEFLQNVNNFDKKIQLILD
jgi:hypothetical protein